MAENDKRERNRKQRRDEGEDRREPAGLFGSLTNASLPQAPSPTQPDTSPTEGAPEGIGGLEFEDLEDDAMDEALEASDLSAEEAVARFKQALPDRKRKRNRNEDASGDSGDTGQ